MKKEEKEEEKKKSNNNKKESLQIALNCSCIITGPSRKLKIIFLTIYKR